MKKSLTMVFCLLVATVVLAAHVTPQQAEQAARAFLNKKDAPQKGKNLRLARRQSLSMNSSGDVAAFYVFNVGQDNGFVMVSGDDRTPSILGYTESGSFCQDELPPHVQAWLDDLTSQMDYLQHADDFVQRPRLAVQRMPVAPLLKSNWNQDEPYNNLCPIDPSTSQRCVTGCIATAMAQVVNYHKVPHQTIAPIPAYTTYSKNISMPQIGITTIDWTNMLDVYGSDATEAEQTAVATLMLLCGQGTEMDYTSDQSGSSSIPMVTTLRNYLGFDASTRILNRSDYSADQWDDLLYHELSQGRPVLYTGVSSGGGHAFVIDGYSADGLFHVNWGWGGKSDGYYRISVLNPHSTDGIGSSRSSDGYSIDQDAVVGIQHGSDEAVPQLLSIRSIENQGGATYTRSSASDDFTGISVKVLGYNYTGVMAEKMYLGVALLDDEDEWAVNDVLDGVYYSNLDNYYGFSYPFDVSFGASLPDGDYYIVPVSASEMSVVWENAYGSNIFRIKATISGNTMTLQEPSVSLNATIQPEGKTNAAHTLRLKARITNNGSYFSDYVYLAVDGTLVGGRAFEAPQGATRDFEIDFLPSTAGSKTVGLYYKDGDDYVPFAQTQIVVSAPVADNHLSGGLSILNADGDVLLSSQAQMQVQLTNDGGGEYDDKVAVRLWKYNPDDGYYWSSGEQLRELVLPLGESVTQTMEFVGLENNADYVVNVYYLNEGGWCEIQRIYFSTSYEKQTPTFNQRITLAEGWNWVSSCLDEPLDVASVAAASNRILSQTDELILDPEYGMVGSLTSLEMGKAYKVQATVTATCVYNGHLNLLPVNVQPGWNWISCPSGEEAPLSSVVTNAEEGDYMVAQTGFSEYDGGTWSGTLTTLKPGTGYLYCSVSAKQLDFYTGASARSIEAQPADSEDNVSELARRYPSTMNITARIYRDGMELPGSQYTVYAYAGNELRGVSQFVGSNHYLTVYGDEPVVISFIVESAETGETFAAAETLTFVSDVVGSRKSPYAVSISTTTGISQQMTDTPMAIYTLDGILVSRDATIRTLHKLPKGVYIVNGRKTVVK